MVDFELQAAWIALLKTKIDLDELQRISKACLKPGPLANRNAIDRRNNIRIDKVMHYVM